MAKKKKNSIDNWQEAYNTLVSIRWSTFYSPSFSFIDLTSLQIQMISSGHDPTLRAVVGRVPREVVD